jgi:uncharacterized protein GlcG (DUF336 family)
LLFVGSYPIRKENLMHRLFMLSLALVLTLVAVMAGRALPTAAQDTPLVAPVPIATQDLSLTQAQTVLAAAIAAAEEQGTRMDIAVVDTGGNLKAFARMDGAWLGSIDIAVTKARTARYFEMPTEALGELSQPGGPLYGIEHSNGGLITFPGGLPLKGSDGTVIGAIGVSGSTVEDDRAVAEVGAAALDGVTDLFDQKSGGGGLRGGVVLDK